MFTESQTRCDLEGTLDAKIKRLGINKYRFKVDQSNLSLSTRQPHRVCSLNNNYSKPSMAGAYKSRPCKQIVNGPVVAFVRVCPRTREA